jgi:hypothetical protein
MYRLSLRCGVLFPKLSKLLNQEGALSAPCSPAGALAARSTASPTASRGAAGQAGMLRTGLIRHF